MGGIKSFIIGLFLGGNIGAILLLWLCCASTWIPPEQYPLLSLIGLAFPVILLVNVLYVFFWLIFKARYVWIPLLGLLVVGSYIYDYCPVNLQREHPRNALKVISFNVGGMKGESSQVALLQYVKEMNADIFCLQELVPSWIRRSDVRLMMDSLQYHSIQEGSECILTRLPVIGEAIHVDFPTRSNNKSMGCRLTYLGDTILVVNNHLESNALSDDDKSEYKEMIKDPHKEKVKEGSRHLAGKLGDAVIYRGPQADSLAALVKANGEHDIFLCGDFNDTPISYVYQKLARITRSAYRDSGQGIGISYNQRGFPVRIDHIFVSKDWRSSQTRIVNKLEVSDHYPIVTYLHKKHQ